MGRTGHSILKTDVKELNAILGGELSGHIVFGREYYLIDDPMFCALKIIELMQQKSCAASELFPDIPEMYSTAEVKAPVPEDKKFQVVLALTESFQAAGLDVVTIDGARVTMDAGWGLVRASNTTANLTLRFESRTREGLGEVRDVFLEHLRAHDFIDLTNVNEAI